MDQKCHSNLDAQILNLSADVSRVVMRAATLSGSLCSQGSPPHRGKSRERTMCEGGSHGGERNFQHGTQTASQNRQSRRKSAKQIKNKSVSEESQSTLTSLITLRSSAVSQIRRHCSRCAPSRLDRSEPSATPPLKKPAVSLFLLVKALLMS